MRVPKNFSGNVVTTKWLLVKKYQNGKFGGYTARLVVRGFSQVYGVDYFETCALRLRRHLDLLAHLPEVSLRFKIWS